MDTMQKSTIRNAKIRREGLACRAWKQGEGKDRNQESSVSNTTKYLAIIWKLPILLKIWYRIIIQESRLLPMQSVISFRN